MGHTKGWSHSLMGKEAQTAKPLWPFAHGQLFSFPKHSKCRLGPVRPMQPVAQLTDVLVSLASVPGPWRQNGIFKAEPFFSRRWSSYKGLYSYGRAKGTAAVHP
jgi:hypothetical protein